MQLLLETARKEKTRLQKNTQRQIVTGLKVNTKVNLDRRYIRTTRAMIHSLSGGIAAANEKFKILHPEKKGNLENIVFGRITYIGMIKGVDSSVYQSLAKKYNNLPLSSKIPTKPRKDVNNLNSRLHFSGYEIKSRLNRCVWVVSFEGVDGISEWDQMTQGTAFMLKGQRILTAAHVFEKAQSPAYCYLYRINEPTQKHKAEIIRKCSISDVAELRIIDPPQNFFEYLKISSNLETNSGYKLAVIGFPQLMNGHTDVTIIPCTVTNTYTRSAIKHVQVDADIQAGNSGGPVINAYAEVVGMATNGISATLDSDSGDINLEGFNSFVSAKHFSTQNQKPTQKSSDGLMLS